MANTSQSAELDTAIHSQERFQTSESRLPKQLLPYPCLRCPREKIQTNALSGHSRCYSSELRSYHDNLSFSLVRRAQCRTNRGSSTNIAIVLDTRFGHGDTHHDLKHYRRMTGAQRLLSPTESQIRTREEKSCPSAPSERRVGR